NLEERIEMACRYRRQVIGIGDLRDEAAILAQGGREPLPRAGRAAINHIRKEPLIERDCFGALLVKLGLKRRHRHDPTRRSAIAALTRARPAGATDSDRKPAFNNAPICAGSLAMSPQRLTGIAFSRPKRATRVIRRMT